MSPNESDNDEYSEDVIALFIGVFLVLIGAIAWRVLHRFAPLVLVGIGLLLVAIVIFKFLQRMNPR